MVPSAARPADATRSGSLVEARSAVPSTDVHLRNYDDCRYTVELVARDDDGDTVERRYDLVPGAFRAERALFEPGTYDVTATVAVGKRDAATCRVGDAPADTVCVEVGNHSVSISDGVF